MKPSSITTVPRGSATVRLMSEQTIECVLEGDVTQSVVQKSVRQTDELAVSLRVNGKHPKLLIDMTRLVSQDSGARSEAKQLAKLGLEKIAVYGASPALTTIGQYIAKIAGMGAYTKFFRSKYQAQRWLDLPPQPKPQNKLYALELAAAIVGLTGATVFIGWLIDSDVLVGIHPALTAMNPVTACNIVLLALSLLLVIRLKHGDRRRFIGVSAIASCLFLYGVLILIGYIFHISTGVDSWLFANKLRSLGAVPAYSSSGTGIFFVIASGLLFLVNTRLKEWFLIGFRILSLIVALLLICIIVGYSFDLKPLYDFFTIPIALNEAFAFAVALVVIIATVFSPELYPAFARSFLRSYWKGLAVFVIIAMLTSFVWRQTLNDINKNSDLQAQQTFEKTVSSLQTKIDVYSDVLHGFKSFFESSEVVTADEFETFFQRSRIEENHHGFNAVAFVRNVAVPNSPNAKYVLTYVAPKTADIATPLGSDIGAQSGRRSIYDAARDSGVPMASDVVSFKNIAGIDEDGFFITVPVYKTGAIEPGSIEQRRKRIYGFVSTTFRNQIIFRDIFASLALEDGVAFRVATSSGKTLYQFSTAKEEHGFSTSRLSRRIDIAGQNWDVMMQTDRGYGTPGFVGSTPSFVLLGGLALGLLSALLLISQVRRRDQAVALASTMTEDLSNERNTSEAMRQKDEAVLASIGDAVFAVDKKEQITLFNPVASMISGFSQAEAIGKNYKDILPFIRESDNKSDNSFIKKALDGKFASMKGNTLLRRKDGSTVAVADSAAPIHDSEGQLIGAIIVFRDVSKERALDQAKTEFVSLASHQLRTPLSAINWYGEMLINGDAGKLTKDQMSYMREIYEGNQRMVELVDSLLNVSRLELGKLKNDVRETSMKETVDSLHKELQASIAAKNLNVKFVIQSKLPNVFADPKLLRMIVQNLLSNAVKYTPEKGTVKLMMHRASDQEIEMAKLRFGTEYLFISVEDTGYGIPLAQQDKVFDKLFRADNVRRLDVEGTGLGLYIVREVAKKLGGTIWFESVEDTGTTFYVVIPFKTTSS